MKTPGRRSMFIAAAVVVLGAVGAIVGIVSYHAGFVNGAGDGVRNVRVAPFFGRGFGEIQVVRDRFPGSALAAVLLALAAVLVIAAIVTALSRRSATRTVAGGNAAVAGAAAGGAAAGVAAGDTIPRETFDEWHRHAHEAQAQLAAGQAAAPAEKKPRGKSKPADGD
jgi:hypothetical protein